MSEGKVNKFVTAFSVSALLYSSFLCSVASAKSAGLQKDAKYNKALYFDQVDNGLILPPLELDYDLSQEQGAQLQMGNATLSSKNFFFSLAPLGRTHAHLAKTLSKSQATQNALLVVWPRDFLESGVIEMISRKGEVLWSATLSSQDLNSWQEQLDQWRRDLVKLGVNEKALHNNGIFRTQWGLTDVDKIPLRNQREAFRFCISQTDGKNSAKLCSQYYGTKSGKTLVMGRVKTDLKNPRVLIAGEESALKNTVPVAADMPLSFFAELKNGESYEFISQPNPLRLMDISESEKSDRLSLVGYDTRPLGPSKILNPDEYGVFTRLLGFQPTIGDSRKFWSTTVSRENGQLFLPGKVGGIFKQRFDLQKIPNMQARAYLHKDSPLGTYVDDTKLFGRKGEGTTVETSQNTVSMDKEAPHLFTWRFKATERGKINRSYLEVKQGENSYRAYYEIYKGFPRELSGRFTGVTASSESLILGEIAYNQWFETLAGWTNYWLGRHRWGISAKHFVSLNDLTVDNSGNTAPLSVTTVDLKYRLSPGLWGRDESVGLISSYQNVTFGDLKAAMLGVGGFWARSMPASLDKLFNLLPFMRYPKWVDVEFIYYMNAMDANIELRESMSLNFHGKVLWTDRVFGEAGFGIKRYGFSDTDLGQKAELNTFYGTIGLGLNF